MPGSKILFISQINSRSTQTLSFWNFADWFKKMKLYYFITFTLALVLSSAVATTDVVMDEFGKRKCVLRGNCNHGSDFGGNFNDYYRDYPGDRNDWPNCGEEYYPLDHMDRSPKCYGTYTTYWGCWKNCYDTCVRKQMTQHDCCKME